MTDRKAMLAPFAEEELRTFKGRGGKDMTFIEDETVMDRLDLGYGPGNWTINVEAVPYAEGVVKVRLGVRGVGVNGPLDWIWYEDFGYPNQKDGDQLKESVSDGIRRCGRYVGIARDLYRKRTYETPSAPQTARSGSMGTLPPNRPPLIRETGSDGLVGKVATAGTQDFQLRETPTGHALAFRLKDAPNRAGQIVLAHDAVAEALSAIRDAVIGQTVTIWGTYSDEETVKSDGRVIGYKVLHLSRIKTPDVIIPPDTGDDLSDLPEEWKAR